MDLSKFLVAGVDLTTVEIRPGLGRVVVANYDSYEVGTQLIREKPVLIWKSGDWCDYIEKFLELPEAEKAIVLDMFAAATSAQDYLASLVLLRCTEMVDQVGSEAKMKQLVAIANTNAHEYYGTVAESFHEVVRPVGERLSSGKSALFAFGSKVAHSW